MRNRINEAVMLFVTSDFADQEDRVQDKTGDDDEEEDAPEEKFETFAPMKDDPTDVERDGCGNEAHA